MRQHFRHLGPSNPAINPKGTRSTTVKIKPGLGTTARVGSTAGDIIQESPQNQDDETTSLLNAVSGKDGIQALHEHYGTVSPVPKTPPTGENGGENGGPKTVADSEDIQDKGTQTRALAPEDELAVSPLSNDSVASLPSDQSHRAPKRSYVRSGSITENVVETRGVRKVVLETTSSNDDEEAIIVSRSPGGGSPKLKAATRSSLSLFGGSSRVEEEEDDDDEDEDEHQHGKGEGGGDGTGETEGGAAEGGGASSSANAQPKAPGRKKNNRRKKRKGGRS
jgi:metal transporter CNNM